VTGQYGDRSLTGRQTNRQTDTHTQAHREPHRQTHRKTHTHTLTHHPLALSRYVKLVSMITDPNLVLVQALGNVVNNDLLDELCQVMMTIFDARNAILPLMFRVAEWEVDQCPTAQTIFRRNSLATKIATACAKVQTEKQR
jgi:adenosyl cobinamide kinase/adenosyl cobinamide phosphate guanylyltransferase